jgi:hypothetical protein
VDLLCHGATEWPHVLGPKPQHQFGSTHGHEPLRFVLTNLHIAQLPLAQFDDATFLVHQGKPRHY